MDDRDVEVAKRTPKRGTSIERENPFRPGGDIEKEVDIILRSSTISADRVTIIDPSSPQYKKTNGTLDMPDGGDDDSQHDSSEQVVVSLNSAADVTDSNDNLKEEKVMPTLVSTPESTPTVTEANGHAADESERIESPERAKPKKKKKDKPKKACEIL